MIKSDKHPRVAVIILNWNGWKDTVECLESLYNINYPNYDVVLVDNASSDDSIQKIEKYCKGNLKVESKFLTFQAGNKPIKIVEHTEDEIKNLNPEEHQDTFPATGGSKKILNLIKNHSNHGFAGGNNTGIEYALKILNPDYLLLLNNDTVVDPDFMTELVKTGEKSKEIGFVGPKTYFYDDDNILQAAGGGNVDFKHGVVYEIASNHEDDGSFDRYMEMDYVGGACLLCRKDVVDEIGALDPGFFMYWEDVNWCLTGKEHGYKSAFSYKSRIWHKYGASSASHFKIYYLNRNRIYVIKQHSEKNEYTYFLMYFFGYRFWVECLDYLLKQRNPKRVKCLIKGALDGLMGP